MLPYISRDVATEPPTTVMIIPIGSQPPAIESSKEVIFAITEDCVEPTDGWVNREGKPLLTVCFMHSFGKCTGRTDFNPRTCFQIHLNSVVLNSLRRHYSNPTRKFFSRTVKATIGPELRQQLSAVARKALKVQYLEYRVQDVYNTLGFMRYEAAYRQWLFGENPHQKDAFPAVSSEQCSLFAEAGSCPSGKHCPFIHASPHNALVRDQVLSQALRRFCAPVGSGSDSSGSDKKDGQDMEGKTSSESNCESEHRKFCATDWSQCPRPHFKVSPIPVYTVEKSEGSVTARLVPYSWHKKNSEPITSVQWVEYIQSWGRVENEMLYTTCIFVKQLHNCIFVWKLPFFYYFFTGTDTGKKYISK